MKKHGSLDSDVTAVAGACTIDSLEPSGDLPHRLMTALEVASFVGCHEESVRRAYLCGQLKRQRFGVRSCRFHPDDVRDWITRGAPTRIGGNRGRTISARKQERRRANGGTKDLQTEGL
jgi:hypothetical protein